MVLIIIFMYAPIVTMMVLSFNGSKSRAKWGGFTFKWYSSLFQNSGIMNALFTTLLIAVLSAVIATVIGTAGAIGINAMKNRYKSLFMSITNIPMLNADIVTGISLMLLFIALKFTMGFATILVAHITFNIPYVILSVMPKLKQTSKSTYEAALDLGASNTYAFRKIVLPDIFLGFVSGFLLAFTMGLDDFIITHFTIGPGVATLSTKIYSEVRKGIKPEMYALSTMLFVLVLLLLFMINMSPEENERTAKNARRSHSRNHQNRHGKKHGVRFILSRVVPAAVAVILIVGGIYYGAKDRISEADNQLVVYNWGEYIDYDLLDQFEEETGIKVIYEEFETNEVMYPKILSGAINYDVVCPSDYMIQRMIQEDLLAEIDWSNIPNAKNISDSAFTMAKYFDSENKYCCPYLWGTVGILYNTTMVDEDVNSWSILWDDKYADSILMQDSVRDAYCVALKYLGYSLNSTDLDELREATDLLISQKPLVQAYVIDQVRDKMIGGEAALGVIYSGEAMVSMSANENLAYAVPDEGSNVWIDGWVIPKNAKHKKNAEIFIDFLCRPDVMVKNFEYIGYAVPSDTAKALIDDADIPYSDVAFPDDSVVDNCETYQFLGDKFDRIYNEFWKEVKSN